MEDILKKAENLILDIEGIDRQLKSVRETEHEETGHQNYIVITICDFTGRRQEALSVREDLEKYIREYYIKDLQESRKKTIEKLKKVMEDL